MLCYTLVLAIWELRIHNGQSVLVSFCWVTNNPQISEASSNEPFFLGSLYEGCWAAPGDRMISGLLPMEPSTLEPRMKEQPLFLTLFSGREQQPQVAKANHRTAFKASALMWPPLCSLTFHWPKQTLGWVCGYTPPTGRE